MATAKDILRLSLGSSDHMLNLYLKDLSDDDLLVVPVAGMNPIAWQLGHLIHAEAKFFCDTLKPGAAPPLPEGFEAAHSKETAAPNTFTKFTDKAEYLRLMKSYRAVTLAIIDEMPEEQLDAATGLDFAPTIAALLSAISVHAMGHIGQFVAVRRKLDKPVVM